MMSSYTELNVFNRPTQVISGPSKPPGQGTSPPAVPYAIHANVQPGRKQLFTVILAAPCQVARLAAAGFSSVNQQAAIWLGCTHSNTEVNQERNDHAPSFCFPPRPASRLAVAGFRYVDQQLSGLPPDGGAAG